MENKNHINCDNCGHEINIEKVLYNQIQKEIFSEYNEKSALEKKELEKNLRKEISGETSAEIETYKNELLKKSEELRDYNKLKAQLEISKREKDELKERIEAEAETKLSQKLLDERKKLQIELTGKSELKIAEKDHLIQQLKTQLEESHRKIEQGSMQLQGEVQEIAIEDYLRKNFPLDTIEEIKKGASGADCLQIVNTRTKNAVGSIYYESKRTKEFQSSWIEKFKADMRARGAGIGIIVTDAFPKDMERLGQKDGIWICSLEEFKGLCFALRESVVLIGEAIATQENKGDKMNLLYKYLTGQEFRMQIEAIVEGFSQMENDLSSEKRSMESIWKKREKQIQKVILNTIHMYSTIKGIAGNSVATIPFLELTITQE